MSETVTAPTTPDNRTAAVLRELQDQIGAANAAKGFHAEGDQLRAFARWADDPHPADLAALRRYYGEKMMLIVSEVAEAQDELRTGHDMTLTYYNEDKPTKPEGVPSELADTVIRCFDLAAEAGIDLGGMIVAKLAYNATRPFMHGKKF